MRTDGRQDDAAADGWRCFGLDHLPFVLSVDVALRIRVCARARAVCERPDSDACACGAHAHCCLFYSDPVCNTAGRVGERTSDAVAARDVDPVGRNSVLRRLDDRAPVTELAVKDID